VFTFAFGKRAVGGDGHGCGCVVVVWCGVLVGCQGTCLTVVEYRIVMCMFKNSRYIPITKEVGKAKGPIRLGNDWQKNE
jgi:hypothetical protein